MSEETYNQFKVRVTDGQNLSEVDPVTLYEDLKSERSEYVDTLKREHRAAVLARHNRVTKRPIITSEVSHGEVGLNPDKEEPIIDSQPSSTEPVAPAEPAKVVPKEPSIERMQLELSLRHACLIEHAFASIMGILAGIGGYVVTREFISLISGVFVKLFAK